VSDTTALGSAGPAAAARGSGEPVYLLEDVSVRLPSSVGPRDVLVGVSFAIQPGDIVGIVGPSGVGKTTLLRVLGGLLPVSGGRADFEGQPIHGPTGAAVTVFQDYANALLPWRTVARNVGLPLERTLGKAERAERVREALELVGLSDRASDYPWRLSGGMQQRVQIARALAVRPRVLLMDEPFGALDALTKAALQDQLLRVQEQTRATVVFITHDLEEAIYLSDRAMVMTGPPGAISCEVGTGLPRPRDQITTKELPRYIEVRHRLGEALRTQPGSPL
jgi:NitT/TauT family transport system ATP-binding protein